MTQCPSLLKKIIVRNTDVSFPRLNAIINTTVTLTAKCQNVPVKTSVRELFGNGRKALNPSEQWIVAGKPHLDIEHRTLVVV